MLRYLTPSLLLLTASCLAPSSDSTSDSSAELGTSDAIAACDEITKSNDSGYILYTSCASHHQPRFILLRGLDARQDVALATLPDDDVLERKGFDDRRAWWVLRHEDGSRHLFYLAVDAGTWVQPKKVALGTAPWTISQLVIAHDESVVMVAADQNGSQHVAVAQTSFPVPLDFPLHDNREPALWSSHGGRQIVAALGDNGGSLRGLRRLHLSGAQTTLAPAVTPEFPVQSAAGDSFNGSSFVAFVDKGDSYGVANIDTSTGKAMMMAEGFRAPGSLLTATDDDAWFTARTLDGQAVLQRATRWGTTTAAISTVLVRDPDDLLARVSHDRSAIVFRTGPWGGPIPNALGWISSDGATAPTIVLGKDANMRIHFVDESPRPGRLLVKMRDAAGNHRVRLVDDRTALTLDEWRERVDYRVDGAPTLAGGGGAVFAVKGCDPDLSGSPRGSMLVKLWPSEEALTGCEKDRLRVMSLPATNAIASTNGYGSPTVLRIFQP